MKESKVSELSESNKFCGIILDEMKVKEKLYVCKENKKISNEIKRM